MLKRTEAKLLNVRKLLPLILTIFLVGAGCSSVDEYSVKTPNKLITVSDKDWVKMEDPETYAVNFSAKHKGEGEEFEQVITVFLNAMTPDRIIGKKISDNEYLEMFNGLPGTVTMQLSRDNGEYWVLSRQTFPVSNTELASMNPEESDQSFLLYQLHFQNEIDTTRLLLSSQF